MTTSLTLVPLRCGAVALPQMTLSWERTASAAMKVLDLGAASSAAGGSSRDGWAQPQQRLVFIRPLAL